MADHEPLSDDPAPRVATVLRALLHAIENQEVFGAIDAGFGLNGVIARAYQALDDDLPAAYRKWLTADEAAEAD